MKHKFKYISSMTKPYFLKGGQVNADNPKQLVLEQQLGILNSIHQTPSENYPKWLGRLV